MSEPWEPLPPRHGVDEEWLDEPVPSCPVCGGPVRRNPIGNEPWRCVGQDGEVRPTWRPSAQTEEEEDE
jgi:hypothetical protein